RPLSILGWIVAITGAIGSGKTTLAVRLAAQTGAVHLSSDDIRMSLSRKQRRSGERVFGELHHRFERALEQERSVVLDSTGMSPRFRALLRAHRERIVHVHLLLESAHCFEEREERRTDRSQGALSRAAFLRSKHVEFSNAPDVVVATDDLSLEQVYREVTAAARALGVPVAFASSQC
ncbi:MAG TPA: AAA family ATPase, partial [Candidatus Baltobacteraceae bacterium]|nr:AAA family ATPase [Candidatus Baltobacteraceae bacterium]